MNPPPDLDAAALERLHRLGGEAFVREMAALFQDYVGRKVAEARTAGAAGDLPALQKAAHPIKSSAGNVGATRVQELAAQIEDAARAGQSEVALASLAQLEDAFRAAAAALAAHQPPSPP